jgi:hypothetical protein
MYATNQQRSTLRAHVLRLQTIQDELIIHSVSQQVYHLRETHVHGVCRIINLKLLRDAPADFGMPNIGRLFLDPIMEHCGYQVCGLVLGYDQNEHLYSIFIFHQNGLLYYREPFHCPTSVERLGLDCKVEYSNANLEIMLEAHNIWVQDTQREENDLENTFQAWIPSFPVLYFSWTPPNQILHFQERLPTGKGLSTFSKRCQKTEQWVLRPQVQEYAVVIPTKFKDLHDWADFVDRFVRVRKETNQMHIVPVGAIVGQAHLVQKNAALNGMDSVWLVNNHVDFDTYWTEY